MAGNDANTVLLLHCDGADTSTTFTDVSVGGDHGNATVGNQAQVTTAVKVFGTGSLTLDGSDDRLQFDDHADWDVAGSTTQDYTIDMRVKLADYTVGRTFVCQYDNSNDDGWELYHLDGTGLIFRIRKAAADTVYLAGGEIDDTNWYHVALVKVCSGGGTVVEWGIYKDGTQIAYVSDASFADTFAAVMTIGQQMPSTAYSFNGQIDEIRITKGNPFNAAPNDTPDDTITVPTAAYSADVTRRIFMVT